MASLVATQAAAANQAASFSAELINAKSELQSYLRAIEEDRRWGRRRREYSQERLLRATTN